MKRYFDRRIGGVAVIALLWASPGAAAQDGWLGQITGFTKGLKDSTNVEVAWLGVRQGKPDGVQALLKLANEGNVVAQNLVGYMLDNGVGLKKDSAAASRWFALAARTLPLATYNLAVLYWSGRGVTADRVRAIGLFKMAADLANVPQAMVRVLLDAEARHDNEEVWKWANKAAQAQNPVGQYFVGRIRTERGQYREAEEWLLKAAEQMEPNAAALLSYLYQTGKTGNPDPVSAAMWSQVAAAEGQSGVSATLGATAGLTDEDRRRAENLAKNWLASHRRAPINYTGTLAEVGGLLPTAR